MFTMTLLAWGLRRLVRQGQVILIGPDGGHHVIGKDGQTPRAVIRITDPKLPLRLLLNGEYHLGQGYMDGGIVAEEGSIRDFLEVLAINIGMESATGLKSIPYKLELLASYILQFNPLGRSRANVAHHYDLSDALYRLFLDEDRQYSCAYFESPDDHAGAGPTGQETPYRRQAALEAGHEGAGYRLRLGRAGALSGAQRGVDVTGITLSVEQHKRRRRARAAQAGLSDRVRFVLRDYRDDDGAISTASFRSACSSMSASSHYQRRSSKGAAILLTDDGLPCSIPSAAPTGRATTNPWIRKYIFPGGYVPGSLGSAAGDRAHRLCVTDIEILRLHYAETLNHWRQRFPATRADIAAQSLRRALLPHVGILSGLQRDGVCSYRHHRFPGADIETDRRGSLYPRLYVRGRTGAEISGSVSFGFKLKLMSP